MTDRRPHRPLLAGATAALGVLVGAFLGVYLGLWLASQFSTSPGSENAVLKGLEWLVEAVPYVWLGALLGALLGWLVFPALLGFAMKWPKVWLGLGVQVVVGIALWLTAAFLGSFLDAGAIGAWVLVVLLVLGPPTAGRWFVDRRHLQTVQTDEMPPSGPSPGQ